MSTEITLANPHQAILQQLLQDRYASDVEQLAYFGEPDLAKVNRIVALEMQPRWSLCVKSSPAKPSFLRPPLKGVRVSYYWRAL